MCDGSADAVDQGGGHHAEASGQLQQRFQPRLALTALDQAHLGPVDSGAEAELFLADAGPLPLGGQDFSELLSL
jgi:hypothetical protein